MFSPTRCLRSRGGGVVFAEPLLLGSGGHRCDSGKALSQHSPVVAAARGRPAAVTIGRSLSAPLADDVARKARRAEGLSSDYDRITFPNAHSDFALGELASERAPAE